MFLDIDLLFNFIIVVSVLGPIIILLNVLNRMLRNRYFEYKMIQLHKYRNDAFKGLLFDKQWEPVDNIQTFVDEKRLLDWQETTHAKMELLKYNY